MGNQKYRLLGVEKNLEVDIHTKRLEPNSYLLLSTDGLWGLHWDYIDEIKLSSVIQNNPPQSACDTLIDLSQKAGSTDDITVIVIKMLEG
jgi:serine/threonine protein phosphatase PrpC